MSIDGKNIHEIPETGVSLDRNLSFKIRIFTSCLANYLHIYKNLKNLKNI